MRIRLSVKEKGKIDLYDIIATIAHFTFGVLSALSITISSIFPLISTALFILYEMDEEWKLSDPAYQEIREYSSGFGLGITLLLFAKAVFGIP
jgi:hypothetical protein